MNVAALYDVHGMPWALEAVLAEVEADAVVFGGDFLGGPCPRETLEIIRSLDATLICGNAEEGDAWASTLPLTAQIDGVLYCHATPTSNTPMTTAVTPDEEVRRLFDNTTGTVVIGHTHHQFDRRIGDLRVVNAGSIGMPYEGEVAAFWTLVEDGEPRFKRTPIDVERAIAEIRASSWPGGEEFIAENLLVAVSREEAIAHFEGSR
jgi:diadenosine tetraphosphatase ApaH/serine/threonine PP2A family protein phosphatase